MKGVGMSRVMSARSPIPRSPVPPSNSEGSGRWGRRESTPDQKSGLLAAFNISSPAPTHESVPAKPPESSARRRPSPARSQSSCHDEEADIKPIERKIHRGDSLAVYEEDDPRSALSPSSLPSSPPPAAPAPPPPRTPRHASLTRGHSIVVDHREQRTLNSGAFGAKLSVYWRVQCKQIFDMYDKNGDNVINVDELGGILEILGYSPTPEEVQQILERFDQDKSGTIDFDEYLVLIQHWIEQDETQIYDAFKVFDKDGDGFVSATELKRALTQYGEQFTEEEANEFFNMMDTDGDGVINYEEFVEYLRSMQKYSTE